MYHPTLVGDQDRILSEVDHEGGGIWDNIKMGWPATKVKTMEGMNFDLGEANVVIDLKKRKLTDAKKKKLSKQHGIKLKEKVATWNEMRGKAHHFRKWMVEEPSNELKCHG